MSKTLNQLKEEIDALGNKIRDLKTSGGDKAEIGTAVEGLLAAKKNYAELNNGIGVDGKPYVDPKEGKKKKGGGGGGGGGGGNPKEAIDPNSINAQKKAAKKESKKAAKAAMKAGGGGGGGGDGAAPVSKQQQKQQHQQAFSSKTPTVSTTSFARSIPSLQIVINPNQHDWFDRPLVAMTVAVLTGTIVDYTISSDHKARHAALGLPNGGVVVGDSAMARYIARRASSNSNSSNPPAGSANACASLLLGPTPEDQAIIDAWIDYAQSISHKSLDTAQRINAVVMTLEHALLDRTYLVGSSITLADLSLFATVLGIFAPTSHTTSTHQRVLTNLPVGAVATKRWITMIASCPAIEEAMQLVIGVANSAEWEEEDADGPSLDSLVTGMNLLEGGIPGRVVTRFPPEPSGYLHVGHAKAVLLNDYYARRYKGRLIVRFDDTNPTKEKEEYQQSIVEDLARLDVRPDVVTYTSDYFPVIYGYAVWMIEQGLAYMDDTPQEQMKQERAERQESKHRSSQTPADAKKYFELMCKGSQEGAAWCLRAKIDMSSDNGTMRDPVLFRQNTAPHHRTGTTYKAYPTYDMACPIVDSIEGVTHALRTTEYNDRDEQYQWILNALKMQRKTRIHAFSRVNFMYTVLSKRKLTWFVENGYVTGWDDPRFPTVRGVVRRGLHPVALRKFIYSQGASRRVVNMEWNKFWAENKKEIDGQAKRFMAIDKESHVPLTITNAPKVSENAFLETTLHPKNPDLGTRVMRIGDEVLLEPVDVEGIQTGEDIVLLRWGVIKITNVASGEGNKVKSLVGEFIPDGDFKAAKRKLSWMVNSPKTNPTVVLTELDNLISKEKLEEDDKFEDFINPNTMATTEVIGDAGLKTLQEHDVIQLERRGFYRVDRPYVSKDKPLILLMIPDGKTKAMSGLSGKLAHR